MIWAQWLQSINAKQIIKQSSINHKMDNNLISIWTALVSKPYIINISPEVTFVNEEQ